MFFGFAFEEFYGSEPTFRAGGVRTFPLLAFAGAALWLIEPRYGAAFIAGLFVLGAWLYAYIRASFAAPQPPVDGPLIVPVSVVIAYVLGPAALVLPTWMPVVLVVGAVLLLGSRKSLHALVARVPESEVLTAGQFLLLVGVVLPLLYGLPRIPYTQITPFTVWLAVVAVSTLSYASYLLQRYALARSGVLLTAALGGLYSSTATTVVLARAAHDGGITNEISGAMVAATGMMYVRMLVIVSIFDLALAQRLLFPFALLAILSGAVAFAFVRRSAPDATVTISHGNPLRLGTAVIFALLLVVISLLSQWVQTHLGAQGVYALAAVVGFTDIDPFVVSLAQGGAQTIGVATAAAAIVIASSSNNVLKAAYAAIFSRRRESAVPAAALSGLALAGLALTLTIH